MSTVAVFGSGGWGTAIAGLLARKTGTVVRLWAARPQTATRLIADGENKAQLPGVPIPPAVRVTADAAEAAADADGWVTAIPTAFLRTTLARLRTAYRPATPVVSLTKGIEHDTFRRPSEIVAEMLGAAPVAVLSGPSHAEEVARGLPTSVAVACPDGGVCGWIQDTFATDRL